LVSDKAQEGLDQHSYYNLGNTFFRAEQYEAAIEAYKEALRLDPSDLEAKQNLELALRQRQQQQQEQQQQQQQDEQQQDQQQQDQEQQDQQEEQQQDDQQDGQEQVEQQENQASGQPQQSGGLTKEQAEQLLEAAARAAESLEEFLQQIMVFPSAPPAEDW
jgi:Ca-activated chloride channel family protein